MKELERATRDRTGAAELLKVLVATLLDCLDLAFHIFPRVRRKILLVVSWHIDPRDVRAPIVLQNFIGITISAGQRTSLEAVKSGDPTLIDMG